MNFKNIKVGMKLKLVRRNDNSIYHGLKIGDILKVEYFNKEQKWFDLGNNFCVTKELSYCWKNVNISLKELLE